ncbi:hypothetical protein KIPB_009776, partial [Kipferlia bialata]|eukprot:g9776.t1
MSRPTEEAPRQPPKGHTND